MWSLTVRRACRIAPVVVALALAITSCGSGSSAGGSPSTGAQDASAESGTSSSASTSAPPSAAAPADPTSITGEATEGECNWVDVSEFTALEPGLADLKGPGRLLEIQSTLGTGRRCAFFGSTSRANMTVISNYPADAVAKFWEDLHTFSPGAGLQFAEVVGLGGDAVWHLGPIQNDMVEESVFMKTADKLYFVAYQVPGVPADITPNKDELVAILKATLPK